MRKRILALILLLPSVLLFGCSGAGKVQGGYTGSVPLDMRQYEEGKELMSLAENREEALKIAELYGVELVSYSYGVAVYHTDENPQDVIRRGSDNGWPLIEINYSVQMY